MFTNFCQNGCRMGGMEWLLDIVLIVLLAATLFHALRLERALGVLKRDRATLQELITGFNASTQAAEQGVGRLRAAADGAGRTLARQIEAAQSLKDDLGFLAERGERLADRLDTLVRKGRAIAPEPPRAAEQRGFELATVPPYRPEPQRGGLYQPGPTDDVASEKRGRSQAERDLMAALRMVR